LRALQKQGERNLTDREKIKMPGGATKFAYKTKPSIVIRVRGESSQQKRKSYDAWLENKKKSAEQIRKQKEQNEKAEVKRKREDEERMRRNQEMYKSWLEKQFQRDMEKEERKLKTMRRRWNSKSSVKKVVINRPKSAKTSAKAF